MDSFKRSLLYCFFAGLLMITAVACQANDTETDTATDTETSEAETSPVDEETSATDSSQDESGEQTIVTFAVNGWERGLYEDQVELFEEANPDIKIEMISVDELLDTEGSGIVVVSDQQDESLISLVQGADVISWYLQPGFVQDGLLLDLNPLIDGDDDFEAEDYYPGTLERYQWDGGTWGIPLNASYTVIFYDKDLFDKAGVTYPEVGWSWDDFLATAEAVTMRDGDEVTQWGFYSQFMDPLELVQAKIGPIFDLESDPPTARLEDPEVIAAVQWFVDLHTEYEVAPYAPEPQSEEDYLAYEEIFMAMEDGKVAMWPDSLESYTWRSEDRNLGVVAFPVSDDNPNSTPTQNYGGSILAMSAGTTHPEAAWAWVKHLTEQNSNEFAFFGGDGPTSLPARQSVAEASGVWDEMDEALVPAAQFAVEHGFVSSYPPAAGEKLYGLLSTIIDEEKETGEALAEAQEEFDSGIEEILGDREDVEDIPEFTVAEPPSSQIEEGDIVVRFVATDGDTSLYRRAAEDFHELHPDIVIKVEEPNFYNEEFSVKALIGEADVFQWWNPLTADEDLALVLPLQPFLSADADLSEEAFFPAALDQFRSQGQVVGLPAQVQVPFLNYNKRVFDAAGVDYPTAGWTLDDFLETAVALTNDESDDEKVYGYMADLFELGEVLVFLSLQDATLIDKSVDPPMANFTDPDTISALRWYTNLTTEYEVKPYFDMDSQSFESSSNPYEMRLALMENDRVAIWKGDPYEGIYYDENGEQVEEEGREHIGVVPYPVGPSGTTTFESSSGYYIAADTDVRQAAWEWVKYLSAQESLVQYGLPARIDVAESDDFMQRVGTEKATVMIDAVQNSTHGSLSNELFGSSNWISPAIGIGIENAYQEILSGEVTVEEAMQIAQDKANTYQQCIIENDLLESNDYEEYENCLEEADLSWGY